SEEVVALWASDPRSPFQGLGRPTIKTPGDRRGHTLDFTLRDRSTNLVYVAEMKCEIEYLGFTYFVLERLDQLDHHKKPAFAALLRAAKGDGSQEVYLDGKKIEVHGAILIWGAATDEGKRAVVEEKGFHTVLTVADICRDLASWNHKGFQEL